MCYDPTTLYAFPLPIVKTKQVLKKNLQGCDNDNICKWKSKNEIPYEFLKAIV